MTWNNKPGTGAREVIDAFLAKKPKRKGNFETDGTQYIVHGMAIAKHADVQIAESVEHKLLTGQPLVRLAFRILDHLWLKQIYVNHLNLFNGLHVHWYSEKPNFNSKLVEPGTWYTLDEIAAMNYDAPPPVPLRFANARADNCTAELEFV